MTTFQVISIILLAIAIVLALENEKSRRILSWTPEIILTLETLFYWINSSPLNPIAMALLFMLILQFIYKNKTSGLVISVIFFVLNLYMCLALASELNEFPSWTENAKLMLLVGGTIIGVGLIASSLMLIKWVKVFPTTVQASS